MLHSLRIQGFKLFRDLELPDLRRLNLILGSNSSGKSCLLEAIRLYTTEGGLRVIRELVTSRDGDWETNISSPQELGGNMFGDFENPIRFLFHDFNYRDSLYSSIKIGPIDSSHELRLSVGIYRRVHAEGGEVRFTRADSSSGQSGEEIAEMLEVLVGRRRSLLRLDEIWNQKSFAQRRPREEFPETPIVAVGANGIQPADVASLFDKVSLTPQQEQVLKCLRLVDPRIEGIALVGGRGRGEERPRTPVVRVRGSKERFPLNALGDGLTRLFHIALAMVNAQGGRVLIDEFENGLYWEVQEKLWPVIFEMAEMLDVQVFATTHSSDCLRSFTSAWRDSPGAGSIHRLERTEASARVSRLPMINISDALASQVEVR